MDRRERICPLARHRLARLCAGLWLCLLAVLTQPLAAQISNEQLVNNHGTAFSYQRSYTPAAGSDRVVIAIIFSEYEQSQNSEVTSATLGGRAMEPLGTIDGVRAKRNRMTAFIMREADLPSGSSTFRVTYGPDPSASLIYLATVLNIDQASAASPPRAFVRDCTSQNSAGAGTIGFGAVAARANDYVFSFVGTGQNNAFTRFNNGADELFDERVFGPGFSFAGGVQTPLAATTIAGTASLTNGCNNRPSTFQLVLRPLLGSDAMVNAPAALGVGQGQVIEVSDADRNTRSAVSDTITVSVRNVRTGETEQVTLTETGPGSGTFRAALPTADANTGSSNNGTMNGRAGDRLEVTYRDVLNSDGAARNLTAVTRLLQTGGPARLTAAKTSRMLETSGENRYALPQVEVVYTITVTNTGDGAADGGSLFILDTLPPQTDFFNGDFLVGDGDNAPVLVSAGTTGLTFNAATDLRYAPAGNPPASFAACTLAANAGFDSRVRYLCIRPQGRMLPDVPRPAVTLQYRARIR